MKKIKLDYEEKQILQDYDSGLFESVPNLKEQIKYYKKMAQYTLKKSKNINIRVTERVYAKLKAKSLEEGIPYQTLISSILHKYVNGTL